MSNVKIKKAKIKDDIFLEVEYTEELPGHGKKDMKLTCTVPVHEDLKNAFKKLDKHLALLCEEIDLPAKVKNIDEWVPDELSSFAVRGFTIGGNDDTEGCTLGGIKWGVYGSFSLNSPFQKYSTSEYKYIDALASDIQDCLYEVDEYLFKGKRAPEQQLAMDFDDAEEQAGDDDLDLAEIENPKPKKGCKKKTEE